MECIAIRGGVSFIAIRNNACYVATRENPVYTIIFKNYNGAILSTQQVEYGTMPTAPPVPERTDGYVFTGWDSTVAKATANKTYTAVFSKLEETTIQLTKGTNTIEVPLGVKVVKVYVSAQGANNGGDWYFAESEVVHGTQTWATAYTSNDKKKESTVYVGVTGGDTYVLSVTLDLSLSGTVVAQVSWSIDINNEEPTITDY